MQSFVLKQDKFIQKCGFVLKTGYIHTEMQFCVKNRRIIHLWTGSCFQGLISHQYFEVQQYFLKQPLVECNCLFPEVWRDIWLVCIS